MKKIYFYILLLLLVSNYSHATHYYKKVASIVYMKNICFSYSNTVSNSYEQKQWEDALKKAVVKYNQAFYYNSKIAFSYAPAYSNCSTLPSHNVSIHFGDYGNEYNNDPYNAWGAMADTVSFWGNKPGSWIKLNLANSANLFNYYDIDLKAELLIHEIGHILGLNHTNTSGNPISVTNNDPYPMSSIFAESGSRNTSGPDFSSYDLKAFVFLYPN